MHFSNYHFIHIHFIHIELAAIFFGPSLCMEYYCYSLYKLNKQSGANVLHVPSASLQEHNDVPVSKPTVCLHEHTQQDSLHIAAVAVYT